MCRGVASGLCKSVNSAQDLCVEDDREVQAELGQLADVSGREVEDAWVAQPVK